MKKRIGAMLAVAPLSLILLNTSTAVGESPQISPGTGSLLTSSTVTVRAKAPADGGTLFVDGEARASGADEWLTFTIDGHAIPNSSHSVTLDAKDPADSGSSYFWMSVPASAPTGLSVSASGHTITASWNANDEPDITGYTVRSSYASNSASARACSGTCSASFNVPTDIKGTLSVSVVARRAGGAGLSFPAYGSVELVAPAEPDPSTTTPSAQSPSPSPAPSSSNSSATSPRPRPVPSGTSPSSSSSTPTPAPTTPSPSPFFPTNGAPPKIPDWLSPTTAPGTTPTDHGGDLFPSIAPEAGPSPSNAQVVNAGSNSKLGAYDRDHWTRALAIVLAGLVCAAHLGTWRYRHSRLWLAKALAAAERVAPGSAHARVNAERERIAAAAVAARTRSEESGLRRRGRTLKRTAEPKPSRNSLVHRTGRRPRRWSRSTARRSG